MKTPFRGPSQFDFDAGGYDPMDSDWQDVTVLGSRYQQQVDARIANRWRHREYAKGPWLEGPAPDMTTKGGE